jgi:hypothetical protein
MAKTMSPSMQEMTDGQIDKAVDAYRAMLRKHRSELGSESVQQVLTQPNYLGEQVGVLRRFVEAVSNMIIRCVEVNRSQKPQEAIKATGRVQYVNDDVVASMPHGEGEDAEVVFFNLGRYISDDDLEKEYELRGLKPVDPYSLAKVNEDDPVFADTKSNATHWRDSNGKWCYAAFRRWNVSERYVRVSRHDCDWDDDWWFAGVRK